MSTLPRGRKKKSRIKGVAAQPLFLDLDSNDTSQILQDVLLPSGIELEDWITSNLIQFYNDINEFFAAIHPYCTKATCPEMIAGPNATYLWADEIITEPVELPAKEYIDQLISWIHRNVFNEKIFPTSESVPFPSSWRPAVEQMLKRMIRVYGHFYFCHFQEFQKFNLEKKLNKCFTYFYSFIVSYDLVNPADMEPMQYVIEPLNAHIMEVNNKEESSNAVEARVLFDFTATGSRMMNLKRNTIINVLSTENNDWWLGQYGAETGFFPKKFVKLLNDRRDYAIVVNDYTAADDKELSMKAGDVVILIDCEDDVFWEGQIDERIGYFPKQYVQKINDNE